MIGAVCTVAAIDSNDPVLTALRGPGNAALSAASFAVVAVLIRRGHVGSLIGKLLVLLWILPPFALLGAQLLFEAGKREVLRTEPALARSLGRHFVVGYTSFDEVADLAEKGLIGGVYVARHNVAGRTAAAVKAELAALQARRRAAGLPPLIVAADQEGGIVAHLAPPLTALPALATLVGLPPDLRQRRAEAFGRIHGRELAELGVNLNFAPVLDLKPAAGHNLFDHNTLIGQRAIADDPAVVGEIARAYVHGLESAGVGATLKHFPGLGRVRSDTHLFDASLDAPVEVLQAADWRPFREVLAASNAAVMVGHVSMPAIDPGRPASHSKRVIDGILRKEWGYQGLVITDDLVMGAIYQHDVCTAVVEALDAGADLLLVAFDGAQFYRIFTCAADAAAQGRLDQATLQLSDARLQQRISSQPASPRVAAQRAGD
ncbi:glycoside hydrolase family 3 N-terminal domain-containing protein [Bradyrhizobium sp.]|uniref:glycoside hydrolase family 3 N-terminal domain-containing protein n=1 Tax=Bradyrhizobium sp. TaxID=376 RepID=UPI00345D019F